MPANSPSPNGGGERTSIDGDLYQQLRRLRTELAKEDGIAPFMVFHDKTLRSIASLRPRSLDALETVPGIGPA
ncbi:MAG: ATP-dependent DNA helicase RecQ, partial [Nitrospiraceae bacterium]